MKVKFFIGIVTLVLLGWYGVSLFLINVPKKSEIDMVYINQVIKGMEEGREIQGEKVYDYTIIKEIDPNYETEINEALKNREVVVELEREAGFEEKIIFYTEFQKGQEETREKLIKMVTLIFILLFCMGIIYLIYLEKRLYRPFKKLNQFAQSIAGGNLEIPLDMDKKNVFGPFTESFDIMREELKTAKHKEALANNSKRELIASLSHDIKTPVASIKAVSELLLAVTEDEKAKPKLKIIYEKAEQIDALITDMFHATLEELGELQVNAIEEYSSVLYGLIKNSDYNNKTKISEIPKALILIDSLRLGQVLDNVIVNSYKYADSPIEISFTLRELFLEMHIQDKGTGMNPEELNLIFNKFYRGTNAETKTGSGLGLYISKYLMERQMGDVVCSNTNSGFRVTLVMKLAS